MGRRTKRRTNQKGNLGQTLRAIRKEKGVGIKVIAPKLGVNYSYLSKIENGYSSPSAEFLSRLADYFRVDRDDLYAAAGKLPPDVSRILDEHRAEAVELLRRRFNRDGANR